MAAVNRTYTPRTTRLLSEYLALTYPNAKVIQELHLTAVNAAAVAAAGAGVSPRFGSTIMGYADAAVILPGRVLLWEAKDRPTASGVGQLVGYGQLWRLSHESTLYPDSALSLHLLVAHDVPNLSASARVQGIEVVVYDPAWYEESSAESERNSAVRRAEALAQPILELVSEGKLSKGDAVTKLISLGLSADSAVQSVENASLPVPNPV